MFCPGSSSSSLHTHWLSWLQFISSGKWSNFYLHNLFLSKLQADTSNCLLGHSSISWKHHARKSSHCEPCPPPMVPISGDWHHNLSTPFSSQNWTSWILHLPTSIPQLLGFSGCFFKLPLLSNHCYLPVEAVIVWFLTSLSTGISASSHAPCTPHPIYSLFCSQRNPFKNASGGVPRWLSLLSIWLGSSGDLRVLGSTPAWGSTLRSISVEILFPSPSTPPPACMLLFSPHLYNK